MAETIVARWAGRPPVPYNSPTMEPRIQFAQTEDGVSIAHYSLGEGMPLVVMPNIPFSHIQLEWQAAEYREWNEHIVQRRRLIRYDSRGQGLSDRDVTEYSLAAHLLDLGAGGGGARCVGEGSRGDPARRFAALMRESTTPEAAQAAFDATLDFDVSPLLPEIKCPTLVMHRREYPLVAVDIASRPASRIPNAGLAVLEGTSAAPWLGDTEGVLAVIDEFLDEGEEAAGARAQATRAFRP